MIYVFADEAGDLADGENDCFLLAAVKTRDHRALSHVMRRTRKRKLTKKQLAGRREIKASQATDKFKTYYYNKLVELDIDIHCLHLRVGDLPAHLLSERGLLFLRLTEELLKISDVLRFQQIYFHQDERSLKGLTVREFDTTLKASFGTRLRPNSLFAVHHEMSHTNMNIQAADFVCHALYQKHQRGDSRWYDVISNKIRKELNAIEVLR